jgi:hypothetical protein
VEGETRGSGAGEGEGARDERAWRAESEMRRRVGVKSQGSACLEGGERDAQREQLGERRLPPSLAARSWRGEVTQRGLYEGGEGLQRLLEH